MTEAIPLSEWNRVIDHLRRWAGDADVTADDQHARVQFTTAQFTVYRDGRVDAGMPLHEMDAAASELVFDNDAVHVQGEDLAYTFRRP